MCNQFKSFCLFNKTKVMRLALFESDRFRFGWEFSVLSSDPHGFQTGKEDVEG